eukprot:2807676-Pleurochrysis_carterae.AAC.1
MSGEQSARFSRTIRFSVAELNGITEKYSHPVSGGADTVTNLLQRHLPYRPFIGGMEFGGIFKGQRFKYGFGAGFTWQLKKLLALLCQILKGFR